MADDKHVSELLAKVFRRGGMVRGVKRAQAVLLWPQVAGTQLARFTRARNLVDGVLIVEVSDSETAMHLTLQRQRFLDVFRGKFGAREVRDIRFQPGRVAHPEDAAEAGAPAVPVDPAARANLYRTLGQLELPEELSGPALQAADAMLAYRARRLAQGWTPCPACGALRAGTGLCTTCGRYAAEPRVRRAAVRLTVDPDVLLTADGRAALNLSEEEGAVASLLAQEELRRHVDELLPQVLARPELRPQLEAAARCLLALRLGKPQAQVNDADLGNLPVRVARILGHWSEDA